MPFSLKLCTINHRGQRPADIIRRMGLIVQDGEKEGWTVYVPINVYVGVRGKNNNNKKTVYKNIIHGRMKVIVTTGSSH